MCSYLKEKWNLFCFWMVYIGDCIYDTFNLVGYIRKKRKIRKFKSKFNKKIYSEYKKLI